MPGMKEYAYTWTLTTGSTAGAWIDTGWAKEHTFLIECSTGATDGASFLFETRISNSTVLHMIGSTLSVGPSSHVMVNVSGCYPEIRPRITGSTGSIIIQGHGIS